MEGRKRGLSYFFFDLEKTPGEDFNKKSQLLHRV